MVDDPILVPPEAHDGLEDLRRAGALDPDDREAARMAASERGYHDAEQWIEQVGEDVYERVARGEFTSQGDD